MTTSGSKSSTPPSSNPRADRLYQIALHVEDAFALRTHLAKNGLQVPPGVPKGQMKNFNFTVKDPNGYIIEFVQYMPDGWTLRDKGKFLPDTRISDHIAHAGAVTARPAGDHALLLRHPGVQGKLARLGRWQGTGVGSPEDAGRP